MDAAATVAKSLQSCRTLCDPRDGSPPGFPVPGILQARTLEWVAISFSNAWMWKVKVKSLSRFWLLATPCTAAHQAPPSTGFSRQKYWSGVPLPSPTWINVCNLYIIVYTCTHTCACTHTHMHFALPLFFPFHLAMTLHHGLTWPEDWHLETAMLKVRTIN